MKKIIGIVLISGLQASLAFGSTQTISCGTGQSFEQFTATLDNANFDVASGLFDVKDASIVDNYATASLICEGHSLDSISCVGFWDLSTSSVVQVKTSKQNDKVVLSLNNLTAAPVPATSGWTCTVQ